MKELFQLLANLVLILFLAYSSWYGAENLGQRFPLGWESIPGLTFSGLVNALCIFFVSLSLGYILLQCYRTKRPTKLEMMILFYPVLVVANFRGMTRQYLVGAENGIFLSVLFLSLMRREQMARLLVPFHRWGAVSQGVAFILAIALPFLITIDNPSYYVVWRHYGDTGPGEGIDRFVGWLGIATYFGFLGLSAVVAGCFTLLKNGASRLLQGFSVVMILFGLLGIYLSAHRISLLAVSVFAMSAFLVQRRKGLRFQAHFFLAFFVLSFALQFVGKMALKNQFFGYGTKAPPMPTFNLAKPDDRWKNIDEIVQTNGRSYIIKFVLAESTKTPKSFLIGLGTGGISEYVTRMGNVFGGEPHSDYLRVFADMGVLGFTYFSLMGLLILKSVRGTLVLPLLLAFATCMLTDNLFVYPVWGYGPLLLAGLQVVRRPDDKPL